MRISKIKQINGYEFWDYHLTDSEMLEIQKDSQFLKWIDEMPKCLTGKKKTTKFLTEGLSKSLSAEDWVAYSYLLYKVRDYLPDDFILKCCRCRNREHKKHVNYLIFEVVGFGD